MCMDGLYDLHILQWPWYILVWLATRSIEGLPVAREPGLWDSMGGQVDGVYIIK